MVTNHSDHIHIFTPITRIVATKSHPKNLFGLFLTFRVISSLQGYFRDPPKIPSKTSTILTFSRLFLPRKVKITLHGLRLKITRQDSLSLRHLLPVQLAILEKCAKFVQKHFRDLRVSSPQNCVTIFGAKMGLTHNFCTIFLSTLGLRLGVSCAQFLHNFLSQV